jgi:large subunit ribosomal protein L32e
MTTKKASKGKEGMLKLRKQLKSRKPVFLREDHQKRACIPLRWRRPRGLHSKMRHRFAGHRALVDPGYGSPKAVFGLHPSGLEPVVVHTLQELAKINPQTQGAVLGSMLGNMRRAQLLGKAKETGIRVLNFKDAEGKIKLINEELSTRKQARASAVKAKEEKTKTQEKTPAKAELAQKVSEEERKKQEKEEKDKVLTSKQ